MHSMNGMLLPMIMFTRYTIYLPKMPTITSDGMRCGDSSIDVIIISTIELIIQGNKKYFFFCGCMNWPTAMRRQQQHHWRNDGKEEEEEKTNRMITIYLVFYFHNNSRSKMCVTHMEMSIRLKIKKKKTTKRRRSSKKNHSHTRTHTLHSSKM